MAVEGFRIIDSDSKTINAAEDFFDNDITFTDGPATVAREIQIQIYAGASSVLSVRRNGTDYPINNGDAVEGTVNFTILVLSTDTLNIRTGGASIPLDVIVAGG